MPPKTRNQRSTKSSSKGKSKAKPKRHESSSTEEGETKGAELLVGEDDDDLESTVKTVTSGRSVKVKPSRSNKNSLDPLIQQVLLEGIECNFGGGREKVRNTKRAIPDLLNALVESGYEDLIGSTTSEARKAADSKIRNWLKLDSDAYSRVCLHFRVTPFELREAGHDHFVPPLGQVSAPPLNSPIASPKAKLKKTAGPPKVISTESYRDPDTSFLSEDEETQVSTKELTSATSSKMTEKPRFQHVGDTLVGKLP